MKIKICLFFIALLSVLACGFVPADNAPLGSIVIPEADLTTSVYCGNLYDPAELQAIVDAKDSAVYMTLPRKDSPVVIADHKHQGFGKIKGLSAGDLVYIVTPEYVDLYYVALIDANGINNGQAYYSNGINIFTGNEDILALYTCNQNSSSITIVCCVKEQRVWINDTALF